VGEPLCQLDRSLDAVHYLEIVGFAALSFYRRTRGSCHSFDRRASGFRFHPFLPIPTVMLLFLLIALLSIAMIDTAVGVVARVGRR
jgi:hypothetical protein